MRSKKSIVAIFLCVLAFVVVGCTVNEGGKNDKSMIREIHVSKSIGLNKENPEILGSLRTEKQIKLYNDALKNAVQLADEVTLDNPTYNFNVINSDNTNQHYQFWDNWTTGRIAEIKDGKITIYEISKESKEALLSLIKEVGSDVSPSSGEDKK